MANKRIFLLSFIFFLSACTSPTVTPPTITSVPEKPTPELSPTSPSPIQVRATQTIEATPSPEPFVGSLAGLIYRDQQGIWKIAKDEEHNLIYDFEGEEYGRIRISPNLDKIIYPLPETTGVLITDLATGATEEMWIYGEFSFCNIDWWEAQPDLLLVGIQSQHTHMACFHIPALKAWDGPILEVLGREQVWPGTMAGSPDGSRIAFDDNGIPWIYTLEEGKKQLNLGVYGFSYPENARFYYPAWSPSGRFLLWLVYGQTDGEQMDGIVVFDMVGKSSKFLHPYFIQGTDGGGPNAEWSSDETHIVLINHGENYVGVIDLESQETVYSSENVLAGFAALSPNGQWIAHYEATRQGTPLPNVIASLDGDRLYQPPQLSIEQWSPDSHLLLILDEESILNEFGAFYIFDVTEGKYYLTDLPPDIKILAWAAD